MTFIINDLSGIVESVIQQGLIDKHLRGLYELVPEKSHLKGSLSHHYHVSTNGISLNKIIKLFGFSNLLSKAARHDICIEIKQVSRLEMDIRFDPQRPFSASRIFGRRPGNRLPLILKA